MPFCRPHAVAT